jgi:hypothetical protein
MTRSSTTIDFIHICNQKGTKRFDTFKDEIGFEAKIFRPYWKKIESIMDFIQDMDEMCHKYVGKRISSKTFFGSIFHYYISSDLRSLIILSTTRQNYQLNIVLRHFIELFVYSFWADIISNFKGTFDYFAIPEEWKPYREQQRIIWDRDKNHPNRSIKERLERIQLINVERADGKLFYKRFFRSASEADIILLFSLPICSECMREKRGKINFTRFRLNRELRRQHKEDKDARYKTDFGYFCCFCQKQRFTEGYAMGIPNMKDMIKMLAALTDDSVSDDVFTLSNVYDYLSKEFVHFSKVIAADTKPKPFNSGQGNISLWGLDGVIFCLNILKRLMHYYYGKLRQQKKRKKRK